MIGPLAFLPIYQERPWGGRSLASRLGRTLPKGDRPIGESWEVVDRPEAQSIITGGTFDGLSLREALTSAPSRLLGPAWDPATPFPILVKWLDCRERLSLQVHPPASVARELGGEPKTENWFIAHAEPGAALLCGLRRGVSRERFEATLRSGGDLADLVHRSQVATGDAMFTRSGQLHAIDAGNLILEIQQNSDTTYRVFDWGRVGLDGKPRALHIEPSLRSIDFSHVEPEPLRAKALGDPGVVLAECDEFRIRHWRLPHGRHTVAPLEGLEARLLSVVSGTATVPGAAGPVQVDAGSTVLLPHADPPSVVVEGPATILVTDRFARS